MFNISSHTNSSHLLELINVMTSDPNQDSSAERERESSIPPKLKSTKYSKYLNRNMKPSHVVN